MNFLKLIVSILLKILNHGSKSKPEYSMKKEKQPKKRRSLNLIKKFEGLRLDAYWCPAGVLTIGYGHTGADVYEGQKITEEEAEALLLKDVENVEENIKKMIVKEVTNNQFDALVSFAYNCGTVNLGRSTLLKYVNQSKYKEAAAEFDKWVYAGKKKLNGLVKRRAAERALFEEVE